MNSRPDPRLLSPDDPPVVRVINPRGASTFVLIGDHAGNTVPATLGSLGLDAGDMQRHIAWDIGIADLGERMSAALDAVFIRQTYSRLVIDCNRDPARADAIPTISDLTRVPGNADVTPADRAARVSAIHAPYQAAIAAELARRDAAKTEAILVSLHSFTPVMQGIARPWHIGVLYSPDHGSFARAVLRRLVARGDLTVGDNQPYAMDGTDHTVPRHAFAAKRRYVEIEIRQDLLVTPQQVAAWSERLVEHLTIAAADMAT